MQNERGMIKINEVREALATRDYAQLLQMWRGAKDSHVEKCDETKKATLLAAMLEAAVFEGTTIAQDGRLRAILDAIDRGIHPYDDPATMAIINALTPPM